MKKSTIITILIVYLAAILAVGFFGVKMKVYDEKVYATDIECLSENYKPYEESKDGVNGEIKIDKYVHGMRIDLLCRCVPSNVTNSDLEYRYDVTLPVEFTENPDHTGYFIINGSCNFVVTIVAEDGKNASMKIRIIVIDPNDIFD